MESVCPYMPKSIRKDCTKLVDAYADEIIEMLIAQLSPEEVCAALKLCSPKGAESKLFISSNLFFQNINYHHLIFRNGLVQ